MYTSLHEDNPTLVDPDTREYTKLGAEYLAKLDNLTGVRYMRLRKGLWVAAEGLIYEDYNPEIHLLPETWTPPEEWRRWWTVDFGYVHPFVMQFWAEDPDGALYLYREIYKTHTLVEDHARMVMKIVRGLPSTARTTDETFNKVAWAEPRPAGIICDHDAEDRATLEKHLGMSTTAATKTVSDGIQAVQVRFRVQPNGRPRIYFKRNAVVELDSELADARKSTSTVDELSGYVWDPPMPGRPAKEAPRKEEDDGMDAMRYMVAELDVGGRPRYRTF